MPFDLPEDIFMRKPQYYQRYPIVVEAIEYDGTIDCARAIRLWLSESLPSNHQDRLSQFLKTKHTLMVPTLEGPKLARAGDYIVRGMLGEIFPMGSEDFLDLFQPAEEDRVAEFKQFFP